MVPLVVSLSVVLLSDGLGEGMVFSESPGGASDVDHDGPV